MNPEIQLTKAELQKKKKVDQKRIIRQYYPTNLALLKVVGKINDIEALSLVQPYHQHNNNTHKNIWIASHLWEALPFKS